MLFFTANIFTHTRGIVICFDTASPHVSGLLTAREFVSVELCTTADVLLYFLYRAHLTGKCRLDVLFTMYFCLSLPRLSGSIC